MRKIFLIRHGIPQIKEKICLGGKLNPPLSSKGYEQLKELKQYFSKEKIDAIYTSPMLRCIESAQEISAESTGLVICPQLREIDMGAFEGLTFGEIKNKFPCEYQKRGKNILEYAPPMGESFSDCILRANSAFLKICSENNGNLLISAHGGINRGIIYLISKSNGKNQQYEGILDIPQPYACVNLILEENQEFYLSFVGKVIV